ncbi:MAG: dethiobiotin synthase [Gammaproteobacteria bacterium]|nr:MAG: dethiobiotin synthase [Gammaproteobacteria bacterium]
MADFFVAGCDTGVGKTLVSCMILHALNQRGMPAFGMKPVATGCQVIKGKTRNQDAMALQRFSSWPVPYEWVNHYAFAPPVAPSIAAKQSDVRVEMHVIRADFCRLRANGGHVVVESAGGWYTPISDEQYMKDIALALDIPVILVVPLKLGCLNQAMLTSRAIRQDGGRLVGWVANQMATDLDHVEEQIGMLDRCLNIPRIASVPVLSELSDDTIVSMANRDLGPDTAFGQLLGPVL